MHVHLVNIGRPQIILVAGRQYSSAIRRRPVEGAAELTLLGFAGDRVSDENVHGGPDKAVCCYPFEHYAWWRDTLGRTLAVPSFGENLTTVDMLETQVCIGDVFRIGTAEVQVTQPRMPCFKLANNLADPRAIVRIHENGFSGFYLRVLTTGAVKGADPIERIAHPHPDLTVHLLLSLRNDRNAAMPSAGRLARLPELSISWREYFERLAAGAE